MSASSVNRAAIQAANRRRTSRHEKTAEWLVIDEKHGKCSRCGYIQETGGVDKTGHAHILYAVYVNCRNCGAHMIRGGDKECQD